MISKYILLTAIFSLLIACGQPTKNSDDNETDGGDRNPRRPVELSDFVINQRLDCGEETCPEYMAKIVVITDGKPTYCTGTLINANTMMTSSSCIPRAIRIRGKYCSDEIFAVFGGKKSEIVPCYQILEVDNKISFLEPAMWKGDYFFFNLNYDVARRTPEIAENGIQNREKLDLWRVDFDNSFRSVLRKDKCLAVQNSYLNPFANSNAHPMQVVSQCESNIGSVGAALINSKGELAGTMSQEMSGNLYNFLRNSTVVSGELNRYHHVTNISCIGFLGQPIDPNKCNPNLSLFRLDSLRADVLRGAQVVHSDMETVNQELNELGKYFKWEFEFQRRAVGGNYQLSISRPVCIRETNNWIREFYANSSGSRIYGPVTRTLSAPNYKFTTKLDSNLQPTSVLEEDGTKDFVVGFNAFTSHVRDNTYVTLKYSLFGQEVNKRFEQIKPCP